MRIKNLKCVTVSNNTQAFPQCVLQDFIGAVLTTVRLLIEIFGYYNEP